MAASADFAAVVNYLERERGVDRETVLQAIESSVEQAARKNTRVSADFTVRIDRKTLEIKAWDVYAVSDTERGFGIVTVEQARRFDPSVNDGDTVKIPMPASKLGRISAQTAKQTIMQKIRDAERSNIYNEYKDRVGDIVSGSVKLVARKDVFVELGKTEAVMLAKERIPTEDYNVGDIVRAYVLRVQNDSSGPAVTLSRACPDFVKALFRQEVSEVAEGVVEIKSVARDPGRRSKVAVRSLDARVDPASACIGTRGTRVRAIVQELNNEKIDIVKYSEDPEIYVAEALKPAEITSIYHNPETGVVEVTVPSDKLSLAIGRGGQNVRLATALTGFKIEITADDEDASDKFEMQVAESQRADKIEALATELNIPSELAEQLFENGFLSPEGILYAEPAYLKSLIDVSDIMLQDLYERARIVVEAKGE